MKMTTRRRLQWWFWNRTYYLVVLIPLALCWLPILYPNPIGFTAYSIAIMAIFWCMELIPLAATALLPMVLFPMFGILKSDDVCKQYLKDTNVLFFGGLMMAAAIEHWNLHRRIALRVLLLVGTKPVWLMFGFMITTAFLSMWMSNTATTAMMIPIAQAVLVQLRDKEQETEDQNIDGISDQNGKMKMQSLGRTDSELNQTEEIKILPAPVITDEKARRQEMYRSMCKGITLAVPYAANIGGTATVTGTGPNLVLSNQVDSLYGPEAGVNFASWMAFALPGMVLNLFLAWIWLQLLYLDNLKIWRKDRLKQTEEQKQRTKRVLQNEYSVLGPMTFAEKAVLIHFAVLVLLWLTRDPKFVEGWSYFFESGFVTDSTAVICVCIVLFCFPSRPLGFLCRKIPEDEDDDVTWRKVPALLNWEVVHEKMAWSVIFLLGGGAAMAEACKASGLSEWLGEQLTVFGNLNASVMTLIISFIVAAFTEITSNTATATIFLPVFAELGESLGVNPLLIMIPATLACSYAFMLPVATPPNAIAFSHGQITVMDMAKTGFMLNILCVCVANLAINTFGVWVFDVKNYPDWIIDETTTAPDLPAIPPNCTQYLEMYLSQQTVTVL